MNRIRASRKMKAHKKLNTIFFILLTTGYSFSLTWVRNKAGKESELLYRVVSLGTFERVAPEWMRDVLMFSMSMCPIFFERICRVIKLHR